MASSYSGDPYWTTARFAGQSANKDGAQIKRGDRIFYYPRERKSYVGANANLIAAAPELLAELERVKYLLAVAADHGTSDENTEAARAGIRAVLAKARGES